jgi:hypothetical protein
VKEKQTQEDWRAHKQCAGTRPHMNGIRYHKEIDGQRGSQWGLVPYGIGQGGTPIDSAT